MRRFWDTENQRFDEIQFIELVEEIIIGKMGTIMGDLSKLTAAVDALEKEIPALQAKISSQGARIVDLEAQLAASSTDQAAIDALTQRVEADTATLTQASA